MLKWFTVAYQLERCIGFLTKAVKRLNELRSAASQEIAMHHTNIDDHETFIAQEEAAIQTLFLNIQRIDKVKGKLEDLLA